MHFDVEIVRSVDEGRLGWPRAVDLEKGRRLGGNHEYFDLRYLSWDDAIDVAREENEIMERVNGADNPDLEWAAIDEELEEDPGLLVLLDPGVASTVVALSAAGCITVSSCNGGAFGDHHHESYPLVAFYARRHHIPILMAAAEKSGVGLESDADGTIIVYADAIDRMRAFAAALLEGRGSFTAS